MILGAGQGRLSVFVFMDVSLSVWKFRVFL